MPTKNNMISIRVTEDDRKMLEGARRMAKVFRMLPPPYPAVTNHDGEQSGDARFRS